jgi:hypothetical protein
MVRFEVLGSKGEGWGNNWAKTSRAKDDAKGNEIVKKRLTFVKGR